MQLRRSSPTPPAVFESRTPCLCQRRDVEARHPEALVWPPSLGPAGSVETSEIRRPPRLRTVDAPNRHPAPGANQEILCAL